MTPAQTDEVVGLDWDRFLRYFAGHWEQGQHVNVAAPTGEGKGIFCTGVLAQRRYVLGFDVKGGDQTLADTGWPRISGKVDRFGHWLPYEHRKRIKDGEPVRLIVGRPVDDLDRLASLWVTQAKILKLAWKDKAWTCYLPDLQLLSDPAMAGIKTQLNLMWLASRNRSVSLVTDLQEFAWTPRLARSQTRWFVCGYTRDLDSVEATGRAAGRSVSEARGMVMALRQRPHSWLVFSNNPRLPVVVTVPEMRPKPRKP